MTPDSTVPSDTDRAEAMRTWHVSPEGLASHRTALDQIAALADWLVANTGEPKDSYGAVDAAINAMTDLKSELDRERRERTEFCSTIGFGGNVSEPAARLPEIIDNVGEAFAAAQDHDECPVECPNCGERLADKPCEWCRGAGGHVAQGAYSECSNCGGDRLIHEGCAGKPYAELAAEVQSLQGRLDTAEGQLAKWREIHKPEKRYTPDDGETSYATYAEAADASFDGIGTPRSVTFFEVCSHCASIEMAEGCGHDYRESLWPCKDAEAAGLGEGDGQ